MELKNISIIMNENELIIYKNNREKFIIYKSELSEGVFDNIKKFIQYSNSTKNMKKIIFKSKQNTDICMNLSDSKDYLIKNSYCKNKNEASSIIKAYIDTGNLYNGVLEIISFNSNNDYNRKEIIIIDSQDDDKTYEFDSVKDAAQWLLEKGLYNNIESSRRNIYKKIEKNSLLKNRYILKYK